MTREKTATLLGMLAVVIGLSFCAFNIYWLLGGTAGLDTIQSSSEAPMPKTAMTIMTVIKIGGALLGLAAVSPLLVRLPKALRRAARILGWAAVIILAMRTIPFVIMDIQAATGKGEPTGIAWFWNTWFATWLLAFLPAMWLSRTNRTPKRAGIARL